MRNTFYVWERMDKATFWHNPGSPQAHVVLASFLQTTPSLLSKRAKQKGTNVMTIIMQTESPFELSP